MKRILLGIALEAACVVADRAYAQRRYKLVRVGASQRRPGCLQFRGGCLPCIVEPPQSPSSEKGASMRLAPVG